MPKLLDPGDDSEAAELESHLIWVSIDNKGFYFRLVDGAKQRFKPQFDESTIGLASSSAGEACSLTAVKPVSSCFAGLQDPLWSPSVLQPLQMKIARAASWSRRSEALLSAG